MINRVPRLHWKEPCGNVRPHETLSMIFNGTEVATLLVLITWSWCSLGSVGKFSSGTNRTWPTRYRGIERYDTIRYPIWYCILHPIRYPVPYPIWNNEKNPILQLKYRNILVIHFICQIVYLAKWIKSDLTQWCIDKSKLIRLKCWLRRFLADTKVS